MKNAVLALCLSFFLAACASQGQRAEIEQRDLFDQQQREQQREPARQAEEERQAQILQEQEELRRQLEEQQRRQQELARQQAEQPVIQPITGAGEGEARLATDPWTRLRDPSPGNLLSQRSIYYEFDRYDISDRYMPLVEAHAKFLMQYPELRVVVQGNCDDRGSREYNLALGQRRAESVKRAMVLLGVNDRQVESVSFGAEKPVAHGADEASWAQNRRSDIVYLNEPE
jgi:peptidoglycan-associated lipoprotein